jgi:hypothetical protein
MNVADMNEIRIKSFIKILEDDKIVHFSYNEYYFEVFESVTDSGYVVNVYSSNEKEDDEYIEANLLDGGTCTGSALDAIYFML